MSPWRFESSVMRTARRRATRTGAPKRGGFSGRSDSIGHDSCLVAGILFAVIACGAAPGANTPSPPQSVAVDARLESTSLVWRAVPPPEAGARQTVRRFFESIARESGPELESLFIEDALFHRPNQPSTPALLAWIRRLAAGDYTKQLIPNDVPVQLLDDQAIEQLASHRSVHIHPQSGDVLAVVPLPPTPQPNALWGSEVQFVLTAREGAWQIRELWEDYSVR